VVLVIVAFLAGSYADWRWLNKNDAPKTVAPSAAPSALAPVPVIASTVTRQDFPIVLSGVGTVTALNSATVRSLVTAHIVSIDFTDGQVVKKGRLLAQLDSASLQAQLDQAEANLARDQAHLDNGEVNLNRYVPLAKQGFAAQQQVDTQRARNAQIQAEIAADNAAIDYAKAQLNHTKLVAPFDGVAGIRLLDVGNIIQASTTSGFPGEPNSLVVINQIHPISVMFTLAAASIPQVQEALAKGSVKVVVQRADGKTDLDTGTLAAIDNQANASSGTITLKAIFPNQDRRLWPGTFVNTQVITTTVDNGLTVPLDAVQQGPDGQYVFVVGDNHTVAVRPVSLRESLHGEALIDVGLREGEMVVVRGQYRLSSGTLVTLADPKDPAKVPNPTTASAGMLP
jgi:multidrug efflux system membrane fusion protein